MLCDICNISFTSKDIKNKIKNRDFSYICDDCKNKNEETENYENKFLTKKDLIRIHKKINLSGYSKLNKDDLINNILSYRKFEKILKDDIILLLKYIGRRKQKKISTNKTKKILIKELKKYKKI